MDTKHQIAKLRFDSKLHKMESGCVEWIGGLFKASGYGAFAYKGKNRLAHRMAWFFENGNLPTDILLHSCDNRKCVNVLHLREGTQYENIHDMISKGRRVVAYSGNNGVSKLTYDQAQEIRHLYKTEGKPQSFYAEQYNIDQSAISRIIHNKIYTHPDESVKK
jgi:hypothetical protein